MHLEHPLLAEGQIGFRGYQANLARIAAREDTLVVLPTGMGKTVVALLVLADALRDGAKRLLVMAPTKPLVEQHEAYFRSVLRSPWNERVQALTGHVAPEKRAAAYESEGLIIATPQAIQNDVLGGRLDLRRFDWVVFDEAHRAVGEYPYTFLGRELQSRARGGRRLGLTASPGHDVQRIDEVRQNLGLGHVEIRTPNDPDVAEYVQDTQVEWETLPMPPSMERVSKRLKDAFAQRVRQLKELGYLKGAGSRPNRMALLEAGRKAQAIIQRSKDPDPGVYQALSIQAQAMKIQHAIEQAETQGSAGFVAYFEALRMEVRRGQGSKASRMVAEDVRIKEAFEIARLDSAENPKMERVATLVAQELEANPDARLIVFTQYRATCEAVRARVAKVPGAMPVVFVGQGKRRGASGLSQKQQAETLDAFRAGTHNVLVATSVAEEGLDIPETDLVVFYEPIPSEIRSIQRRGRTGRQRAGRVVVLMTKGTQDEAAHWTARRKERQMVQELHGLRATLGGRTPPPTAARPLQQTLENGATPAQGGNAHATGDGAVDDNDGATSGASARDGAHAANVPGGRGAAGGAGVEAVGAGAAAGADAAGAVMGQRQGHHPAMGAGTAGGSKATAPTPGLLPGPRIVADSREQAGSVVKHLHGLGAAVETRRLDIADYVLSDRVAVERKSTKDFVDSLVDGRLFEQLKELRTYPRAFLVIEGASMYGHRNVAPEALLGALASAVTDFGVPVLRTEDALETARFLVAVAKREQGRENRKVAVRPAGPGMGDAERQMHLVAGLPGVDAVRADALLRHFGSAAAVFAASEAALAEAPHVGPKTARMIRELLDQPYE